MNDGLANSDRFVAPLKERFFDVDELTVETLISMSADLSKKIAFYNSRNRKYGSWYPLFTRDMALVVAQILAFEPGRYERRFLSYLERFHVEDAASVIFKIATAFDEWYVLTEHPEEQIGAAIHKYLKEAIEKRLMEHLHWLARLFKTLTRRRDQLGIGEDGCATADVVFSRFQKVWRIETTEKASPGPPPLGEGDEVFGTTKQRIRLNAVFNAFVDECQKLKVTCRPLFERLIEDGAREPAAALFIAFLKLFDKIKQQGNWFTARHLDYYFRDYLGFHPRPCVSDRVHAVFPPLPERQQAYIPAGALFDAGKDDTGLPMRFKAESDLRITDATVPVLCTLLFERDDLISPERQLGYVTRIRENRMFLDSSDLEEKEKRLFPIFCGGRAETATDTGKEADIGFAVSSDVLVLGGGEREVTVTLYCELPTPVERDTIRTMASALCETTTPDSYVAAAGMFLKYYLLFEEEYLEPEIIDRINDHTAELFPNDSAIKDMLELSREALFHKVFENIFVISVTTESGWYTVPGYAVAAVEKVSGNQREYGFSVSFILSPEVDPIAVPTEDRCFKKMNADAPMVRLLLNPQTDFYGYSLLKELSLARISVDVAVKKMRRLLAYNQNGLLDASAPFSPFGPMPECGNYLIVGSFETARKWIKKLSVNITWGGLPPFPGGFDLHYRGYDERYDDERFIVDTAVLRSAVWNPEKAAERPKCRLFCNDEKDRSVLQPDTTIEIESADALRPIPRSITEETFRYTGGGTRDGFVKLTLAGPLQAFGHRSYSNVLARVLTHNARSKHDLPLPNAPYTPLINDISLSYEATDTVFSKTPPIATTADSEVQSGLFLIHPFGYEHVSSSTTREKETYRIVPIYPCDGNLLIGVKASKPAGQLSLFFNLREDATLTAVPEKGQLKWRYLASNQWRELKPRQLISDTTRGLLKSGIVQLDIPKEIDRNNTILPNSLYWFALCAEQHLQEFGNIYEVNAHGLLLSRTPCNDMATDYVKTMLPAGRQLRPERTVPGVAGAVTVGESFGGRPLEHRDALNVRAGERLSHRMRASTPRDFERMVLQEFPEVSIVKCFTSRDGGPDPVPPGEVRMVVVPHLKSSFSDVDFMPRAGADLLTRIHDYLEQHASTFAAIKVRNPVFEQILVKCAVASRDDIGEGGTLETLRRTIVAYLSPWNQVGNVTKFGWRISLTHLASHIRQLSCIEYVTALSLLSVTKKGERTYILEDTSAVDRKALGVNDTADALTPLLPWCIAVPFRDHLIEMIPTPAPQRATKSGIRTLEIGKTFIIGDNHSHGQTQ